MFAFRAWLLAPLNYHIRRILMNQQELADELKAVKAQGDKAKAEIIGAVNTLKDKVTELEAVIAAGDSVSPAVEAALADLKDSVKALDDLNADSVPPTP